MASRQHLCRLYASAAGQGQRGVLSRSFQEGFRFFSSTSTGSSPVTNHSSAKNHDVVVWTPSSFDSEHVRNFCVIAHVDQGKSTVCDRLYERALGIKAKSTQMLDDLPVERERGITVKARPLSLVSNTPGEPPFLLNLVDTPGHSDFYGEVTRNLRAVEGAILLVDATQGIQAQTVAAYRAAQESGCVVVPCLNKVDLPHAEVPRWRAEVAALTGTKEADVFELSAKTGAGVEDLLNALPYLLPPPETTLSSEDDAAAAADDDDDDNDDGKQQLAKLLLLDAKAVQHKRGLVCTVRVLRGCVRKGQPMLSSHTHRAHDIHEVGVFDPELRAVDELREGHVGYVCVAMKAGSGEFMAGSMLERVDDARRAGAGAPPPSMKQSTKSTAVTTTSGDNNNNTADEVPFVGVFCGIFPLPGENHHSFQNAVDKLVANEPSVHARPESSQALGLGMRLGFQGPLHKEIFMSRLQQEHGVEVICTAATVPCRISWGGDKVATVASAEQFRSTVDVAEREVSTRSSRAIRTQELLVRLNVLCRSEDVGGILTLLSDRRGVPCEDPDAERRATAGGGGDGGGRSMHVTGYDWQNITYRIPLGSVVDDTFASEMKSLSSGYASYRWDVLGFEDSDIVRLDVLVDGKVAEPLAQLVHRSRAQSTGSELITSLAENISRRQYDVILQASVANRILARTTVKAVRRDVTSKCYGGDVSRKKKLLEKQKEGKKKMKALGARSSSASEDVASAYVDILRVGGGSSGGGRSRR